MNQIQETLAKLSDELAKAMTAAPIKSLLVTRSEAEKLLMVSRSSVLRWQKNGTLPAVRLPGMRATRYRREDVEKLAMAEGRTP